VQPSRSASQTLVVWGAGRGFSNISAGFGCKVGMNAWVRGSKLIFNCGLGGVVLGCCMWSVATALKIYKICSGGNI